VDHIDTIVIGAGAIGLAVAAALARRGREVVVLEAERQIGTGISSRNSEVIHAGIYYPQGSLKARLCVAGRHRLYAYCAERGVPHRRLGKLIVASEEAEVPKLEALRLSAAANGADDPRLLTWEKAQALEPALACSGALLSPSTGIVDSHALMLAYQGEAEDHGATIAFETPFVRGMAEGQGFAIETGGPSPMRLRCRRLVNAAGLAAVAVASRLDGMPAAALPHAWYCKGSYYRLTRRAPFSRLVYPLPGHAGLGVHLTLDMAGQARFGPDTEWGDTPTYDVEPGRAAGFYAAIRRYWPALPDDALAPDYAGVRPKISGPSDPAADFRIDGGERHGLPGLVNLFGIESPGLTASPAIADYVASLLERETGG